MGKYKHDEETKWLLIKERRQAAGIENGHALGLAIGIDRSSTRLTECLKKKKKKKRYCCLS